MKVQITKEIYLKTLDTMKKTLSLIEFGMDMRTNKYKYARSQIMDYFYDNLIKLFKHLEEEKIIEKCPCNTNVRKGFKKCEFCGGSGFRNKTKNEKE